MQSESVSPSLSDFFASLISEEELKEYYSGQYSISELFDLFAERLNFNRANLDAQENNADYNLQIEVLNQYNSFFPSSAARRSWIYIQSLLDARFSPSYYTARKDLQSWMLLQTTGGKGSLRYKGKSYVLGPGDVFFIDCREEQYYKTESPKGWEYRLAHIAGPVEEYFQLLDREHNYVFSFDEDSYFTQTFTALFERNRKENEINELLNHRDLTILLTEICRTLHQYDTGYLPSRIREIQEWTAEHCCEGLSIKEIATHFNLSQYYLCHEFQKYTGETLMGHVSECRLNRARELLLYTERSIGEIAELIGYPTQASFGRAFKRSEGMTPTEFRRQWQGL